MQSGAQNRLSEAAKLHQHLILRTPRV